LAPFCWSRMEFITALAGLTALIYGSMIGCVTEKAGPGQPCHGGAGMVTRPSTLDGLGC